MQCLGRLALCGMLMCAVVACQKKPSGGAGGTEGSAMQSPMDAMDAMGSMASMGGMGGMGSTGGVEGVPGTDGKEGAAATQPRPQVDPARPGDAGTPLDDATARKKTAELFTGLAEKAYKKVESLLAPKTLEALPEPKVKELWEQLLAQLGEYKSFEVVESSTHEAWRRHRVRATFAKGTILVYVVWTTAGEVTGLFVRPDAPEYPPWKPPSYASAEKVREIPITVGEGPLALPGLLTVPAAQGGTRYPAVVLVHGSGPQDRDETIGPNKPFKDLAWGLAAQGIAVLRYDKVTKAHPQKAAALLKGFTLDSETTNDALAAVALLRNHPLVQPERVFYLGHSQGAMAGPRAGQRDPKLAGIILLGGPTRPFEDLGLDQLTYIASLGGPHR